MQYMSSLNNIPTWKSETAHITTAPNTLLFTLFMGNFTGVSKMVKSSVFPLFILVAMTLAGCGQRIAMAPGQLTLSGQIISERTLKYFKNFCLHSQIQSGNFGLGEKTI